MKNELSVLTLSPAFNSEQSVVIMHPFTNEEILNPKFGGAQFVKYEADYLEEIGCRVKVISLSYLYSITSLLNKISSIVRKAKRKEIVLKNEKRRWFLNLLNFLFIDILSRFDIIFRINAKVTLETIQPSLIIYNYCFGFSTINYISKQLGISAIIYEHNVEWYFYKEKLGNNIISNFLINILKKIELNNLRKANHIFCVNKKDHEILVKEGKISPSKIEVWLPLIKREIKTNLDRIPEILKNRLKGKSVVGFIGTNFEPNIVAVENIIKIASKLSNNVVFLIIGSVNKAFKNKNVPSNIIFTGYVKDLDSYLSLCDIFINPKTTSDTGIEIKMLDYLKFDKPIISTEIGARGFEKIDTVKIVPSISTEILRNVFQKGAD